MERLVAPGRELIWCLVALRQIQYGISYVFAGVKKAKSKINMDVKKKEMDLLSNSIAAYAHIKGKSHLSPTECLLYIGLFY